MSNFLAALNDYHLMISIPIVSIALLVYSARTVLSLALASIRLQTFGFNLDLRHPNSASHQIRPVLVGITFPAYSSVMVPGGRTTG
jgi:hypothetical protein